MDQMPSVLITDEMFAKGESLKAQLKVNRTQESKQDTIVGIVGELAFAQWFMGDWRLLKPAHTKGKADIADRIEIKSSAYPMSVDLNLVVREDYAEKRQPEAYVQMILDTPAGGASIEPGMTCFVTGWTVHDRVIQDPPEYLKSQKNKRTGYKSYLVPIPELRPMSSFTFCPIEIRKQMDALNNKAAFAKFDGFGGRRSGWVSKKPAVAGLGDEGPSP
ncbi:MAG: hypothetical protein ABJN42_14445 [Roseibium sp.]|uniref:hypothetical protein n=1 Tax=Roseibium sp. TaxID=1936156 RepID=UPI0032982ABE